MYHVNDYYRVSKCVANPANPTTSQVVFDIKKPELEMYHYEGCKKPWKYHPVLQSAMR